MNEAVGQVIRAQLAWIEGRCRWHARALARAGVVRDSGGWGAADALTMDLLSKAIECVYQKEAEGWFRQQPRTTLMVQVRHRVNLCLRAESTDRLRDAKVAMRSDTVRSDPDAMGDELDIFETIASQDPPLPERLERRQLGVQARKCIEELENPSYRLVLLLFFMPGELRREHLAAAAAFRAGGSTFVVRELNEAWALLHAAIATGEAEEDAAAWKRTVAKILRFACSPEAISASALKTAVNTVDQKLSHAIRALRDAFGDLEVLQ